MLEGADALFGREDELARLRGLADRVERDAGAGAIAIHGPPGAGKTALLDRFAADVGEALEIRRITPVEGESEITFGALDSLLRPLTDELESVPAVQREAIEAALALRDGAAAPLAIGAGTLSLLGGAAERRPQALIVDDLQWVDDASLRALLFAVRRLSREPIVCVLAARGEEEPAVDVRGIDQLRLPPLGEADCMRLLERVTGGRLPAETAAQLVAAGSGNPLVLLELTARLTPAERDGRDPLLGPPRPSAGAGALLGERIGSLPEEARGALLVAATCEDDAIAILTEALSADGRRVGDLAAAEEDGLISLRAGRVSLRHPLVRSVVYHAASPEARRAAHRAVAAALPREDPRRVWHRAAASPEPDEELAEALDGEAARAFLLGGYTSAARARLRAADLSPGRPERVERLLETVNDLEVGGRFEDAARVLDRAAEAAAGEEPTVTRIAGIRASLDLRGGAPLAARERLLGAARALEAELPGSAARYYLQAAFASMAMADADGWRDHAASALPLVPGEDRATLFVARAMLASALLASGETEDADPHLVAVEQHVLDRPPDEPIAGAIEVYAQVARGLGWIERYEAAERMVARLEGDARRVSNGAGLPAVLNTRVRLDVLAGRWSSAAAASGEQIALAREIGDGLYLPAGLVLGAWLAALRGQADECEELASEVLTGPHRDNPAIGGWAHYALAVLALGRGDMDRALAELGPLQEAVGFAEPGSRDWEPDLIEALIRAGEAGSARERLERWRADADIFGRARAQAGALRCEGLLAPEDQFEGSFERALGLLDGLPLPFDVARTQLCLGERRRRGRRRAEAREPLREALATFERLGAADLAARARTELRATGGMVPAQRRSELEELTPHEIQVAMMVAEGRTNREVAAALFLAPKTIEHHLSTIFRKLGIKRRTELARVFATELADGDRGA